MVNSVSPFASSDSPIEKGFVARLFDLSFTSFITPMIIRALYIIGLLVAFIAGVVAVVAALFDNGFWAFIWAAIFAPVWFVVTAVILRVWMEILIAIFRIAQATIETARNTGTRV
jgi:hypothetical protein